MRIAIVSALAAVAATLIFPAMLALRADGNAIIEAQPFDKVLLAVAMILIACGVQLAAWRAAPYAAMLATLASAGLLFSILAIFSVGLVVLPAAAVLLALLYRTLRRGPLHSGRPAAIGGSLVGYGAVLLYIALIVPPLVECSPTGARTSSGRWGGQAQVVTGGITVRPGGVATGTIEAQSWRGSFRCEGGRIVEFRKEPRWSRPRAHHFEPT